MTCPKSESGLHTFENWNDDIAGAGSIWCTKCEEGSFTIADVEAQARNEGEIKGLEKAWRICNGNGHMTGLKLIQLEIKKLKGETK